MRTITPTPFNVYSINELSPDAKKRAIEKVKEIATTDEFLFEATVNYTQEQLDKMGFDDPQIYYSCSYCQGDGACFELKHTMYKFNRFFRAIKKSFNRNQWKALQKAQRAGMDVSLTIKHSGQYYHERSVSICFDINPLGLERSVNGRDVTDFIPEIQEIIESWYEGFCKDLYKQLCGNIEYYWADENCIIFANELEYEFTNNGCLFRG